MRSIIQQSIDIAEVSDLTLPSHSKNQINSCMAYLEVRDSPIIDGRGVFALRNFEIGEVVEVCPVIEILKCNIEGSMLNDYVFSSNVGEEYSAVVLGYGMIYNHADDPNLLWYWDEGSVVFYSVKKIQAESELFHTYGDAWWQDRGESKI